MCTRGCIRGRARPLRPIIGRGRWWRAFLNVSSDQEIIFTYGTTSSINLLVRFCVEYCLALRERLFDRRAG